MEHRSFPLQDASQKSREARLRRLKESRGLTTDSSPNTHTNSKSRPNSSKETKIRRNVKTFQPPTASKSLVQIAIWQCFRLVVAGIGISVIAGTVFAFWNSYSATSTAKVVASSSANLEKNTLNAPNSEPVGAQLKSELPTLATKIKQLAATEPDLKLQTLIVDLDTGSYVDINSRLPIASASMIKVPLLVAFLQDVDAGKVRLDEQLEIKPDVIVGEAGSLQYQPSGTRLSALETLTLMITISDNTATNMIMQRLGGKEAANQRFKSWGLTSTIIRNPLPDLEGTNTTSSQDLVNLLAMVDQGKLITPRSRDRLMDIMRRTVTDTLLPQGIGSEARIAHKTGDIASAVGDVGLIDMPSGKRYIMAAIVKRPDNDQRANELIRQISRATYAQFSPEVKSEPQPSATPTSPANNATDSVTPTPNPSPQAIQSPQLPLNTQP